VRLDFGLVVLEIEFHEFPALQQLDDELGPIAVVELDHAELVTSHRRLLSEVEDGQRYLEHQLLADGTGREG
jgi:hypothetical protein